MYVNNPFQQIRWFSGKNETRETIPPRACCALSNYPDGTSVHGTTYLDEKDPIPYFHLYKPNQTTEAQQDPYGVVFNGPEAIEPGKKGRVTVDFPAAALCGAVPTRASYAIPPLPPQQGFDIYGPVAGQWFMGLGRWAFRHSGQSLDEDKPGSLTPKQPNGKFAYTLLVEPNLVRERYMRSASGVEPVAADSDVPFKFTPILLTGDLQYAGCPFSFGKATTDRPNGETSGIVIHKPGYYHGVASVTIGLPDTGGVAGFVWCITDGSATNPSNPNAIAYTKYHGARMLQWASSYGTKIQSAENVCLPFRSWCDRGNVVHLRTIEATGTYTNGVFVFGQGD